MRDVAPAWTKRLARGSAVFIRRPPGRWRRRARCADRARARARPRSCPRSSAPAAGLLLQHLEAGGVEPLGHGLGRKAEPAMGMLVAQELEIVRREIDHQQPPGRPQHPRRLLDGARAVVEEVQHLVDDDEIEGIARQRQIVDVALPDAAMTQAGAIEPRARHGQHVERKIEAEAAFDLGAEQLQHAAGAGAEIEQGGRRRTSPASARSFSASIPT